MDTQMMAPLAPRFSSPEYKVSDEYFKYKDILFSSTIYTEERLRFAEEEFPVLDDDVFNVTYPKSGTIWMIEILSLIRNNGDPSWNREVPNWDRVPWFETVDGKEKAEQYPPPRMFSSHLPIQLFCKNFFNSKAKSGNSPLFSCSGRHRKVKIIYTMRNPKDVLVSTYYFAQFASFMKTPASFDEFFEDFLKGNVNNGSWFDHIKGWMGLKDKSKIFFITYKELLQDPRGSVMQICEFLGKELDAAAIDLVVKNSSFLAMKNNNMCNYSNMPESFMDLKKGSFLRKGIAGDWKNHFTVAQNERFNRVYKEKMKGLKLKWDEKDPDTELYKIAL